MPDSRWSLAEHRGLDGFAAIEADWRRLYREMPDPSVWHSHEVYAAYLANLCPAPSDFRCLALSDHERVRAILPLEERRDSSFAGLGGGASPRVWGMPWRDGWSVTDAIGPEDDARRALMPAVLEYLRREPDRPAILVLGRAWDGSVLWEGLPRTSAFACYAFADGGEYVVPTNMSAEAFEQRMSRNARQTLRRAGKRFDALDGSRRVRVTAYDEILKEYPKFIEIEASGWKGLHGSAIRQRPGYEEFYRDLLGRLILDGRCEIHALYAEGRCIASGLSAYTPRRCAILMAGYDESYSAVSPGRLRYHVSHLWSCEDPYADMVSEVSTARWMHSWNPETNGMRRAYVALRPVSGAFWITLLRLRYGPIRRTTRAIKDWRREHDSHTTVKRGQDAE